MKPQNTDAAVTPKGRPRSLRDVLLAAGAKGMQTHRALRGFDAYVAGFHCVKDQPQHQMEAHHFCKLVNDELLQCVIFDGDGEDANLLGVEYIVSERLFDELPQEERSLWHPHNFELLSGQLVAPGLPAAAEKALIELLMNSYGKTWHLWHTGAHPGAPGDSLPLGPAQLMWSFNKDGQLDASLERQRNKRLDVAIEDKRKQRADLIPLARPQEGVEVLTNAFSQTQRDYPGVVDKERSQAEPRAMQGDGGVSPAT